MCDRPAERASAPGEFHDKPSAGGDLGASLQGHREVRGSDETWLELVGGGRDGIGWETEQGP